MANGTQTVQAIPKGSATVEPQPLKVSIGGQATLWASPKLFSTGSTGFGAYGRIVLEDGHAYQVSMNVVRIVPKVK